jgi:hypothetical protein
MGKIIRSIIQIATSPDREIDHQITTSPDHEIRHQLPSALAQPCARSL